MRHFDDSSLRKWRAIQIMKWKLNSYGWLSKLWSLLGTLNIRCRIIIGIQKRTIILTITKMYGVSESSDLDCICVFLQLGLKAKCVTVGRSFKHRRHGELVWMAYLYGSFSKQFLHNPRVIMNNLSKYTYVGYPYVYRLVQGTSRYITLCAGSKK